MRADLVATLERTWGRTLGSYFGTYFGTYLGTYFGTLLWDVTLGRTWGRLVGTALEWYARFGKQGKVNSLCDFACWGNPQTPRIFCENSNPFLTKWKSTSLRSVIFERKRA